MSSAAHLEQADGRSGFNYKTQSQLKKRRPPFNRPEKISGWVLLHLHCPHSLSAHRHISKNLNPTEMHNRTLQRI